MGSLKDRAQGGRGDGCGVRVVLVTAPDEDTALALVREAVEARLAACGTVVSGVTSVYRWKGTVHQDPETLIIFKTTDSAVPALKKRVVELHPYETPEFLALPICDGHLPYLQWVTGEVNDEE